MATYTFKAVKDEEEVQGTIDAKSKREAIDKIHERGLIPVEVSQKREGTNEH